MALKLVGIFILLALFVAVLLTLIIKDASREKDHSVLLRILTNYF